LSYTGLSTSALYGSTARLLALGAHHVSALGA